MGFTPVTSARASPSTPAEVTKLTNVSVTPDDPNHPGGSITIVDPPTINDVPMQDCDALEDRMNTCLDNADPTDVQALLNCVDLQFALEDCRALDTALVACGGIEQVVNTCNERRVQAQSAVQTYPKDAC